MLEERERNRCPRDRGEAVPRSRKAREEGFCCFPDQLAFLTDEETEAQRPIVCCMQFGRLLSPRSPAHPEPAPHSECHTSANSHKLLSV